jgi:hypothetical protein
MLVLTIQSRAVRSFFVTFYDADLQELAHYQVPFSVTTPFANRLARDILSIAGALHEPWYTLAARSGHDFVRSPLPLGPTSLYGERYEPTAETVPAIHLHPEALVRYFEVHLFDNQVELYKGVYTVDDIFLHGVHLLLNQRIQNGKLSVEQGPFAYAIIPGSSSSNAIEQDVLPEQAYQVEGIFHLPPRRKEEPLIAFRPIPQPPAAEADPGIFGAVQWHGKGDPQAGLVFMPARVYTELRQQLILSTKKEEGGYLLGNVYRQPGSPESEGGENFRWIVEITDLLMAEDTVGSAMKLLFTGDSWSKINRRRNRDFAERRLVGWFHTHLFPATDSFGLSGLDQDMHAWYLPRPWHVAVLLNLEPDGDRTVRCYQRGPDGSLVETPFAVF